MRLSWLGLGLDLVYLILLENRVVYQLISMGFVLGLDLTNSFLLRSLLYRIYLLDKGTLVKPWCSYRIPCLLMQNRSEKSIFSFSFSFRLDLGFAYLILITCNLV